MVANPWQKVAIPSKDQQLAAVASEFAVAVGLAQRENRVRIEINLVPDVKQELIQAKRVRTLVIVTTTVAAVAIGIVVLLAVYLFGVQTVRQTLADGAIKDKSKAAFECC